ncbi:MAG: hypothetical protein LBS74_08875 [Oscillospiraceae bacterium]|nr:hypothetical protein [Oscillospiraceae bacterium]
MSKAGWTGAVDVTGGSVVVGADVGGWDGIATGAVEAAGFDNSTGVLVFGGSVGLLVLLGVGVGVEAAEVAA